MGPGAWPEQEGALPGGLGCNGGGTAVRRGLSSVVSAVRFGEWVHTGCLHARVDLGSELLLGGHPDLTQPLGARGRPTHASLNGYLVWTFEAVVEIPRGVLGCSAVPLPTPAPQGADGVPASPRGAPDSCLGPSLAHAVLDI